MPTTRGLNPLGHHLTNVLANIIKRHTERHNRKGDAHEIMRFSSTPWGTHKIMCVPLSIRARQEFLGRAASPRRPPPTCASLSKLMQRARRGACLGEKILVRNAATKGRGESNILPKGVYTRFLLTSCGPAGMLARSNFWKHDRRWWAAWSSKPVWGVRSLPGGFDSHVLPPLIISRRLTA